MAEIKININGRQFGIACDDGQEQRVQELASHVNSRLREIAASGGATNESHLLVLTSLVMADEMFDMKAAAANGNSAPLGGLQITQEDESSIVNAIDQMANRIDTIAGNLQKL